MHFPCAAFLRFRKCVSCKFAIAGPSADAGWVFWADESVDAFLFFGADLTWEREFPASRWTGLVPGILDWPVVEGHHVVLAGGAWRFRASGGVGGQFGWKVLPPTELQGHHCVRVAFVQRLCSYTGAPASLAGEESTAAATARRRSADGVAALSTVVRIASHPREGRIRA